MPLYRMDYTASCANAAECTKLSVAMRGAIKELLAVLEDYKDDSRLLHSLRMSPVLESVFIVLESSAHPIATGHHNFDIYLLIRSRQKLNLSEHFQEVSEINLDGFKQERQLTLYDATADYPFIKVDEWVVPNDSIIIIKYELLYSNNGNPPHFCADIYLCTKKSNVSVQATSTISS